MYLSKWSQIWYEGRLWYEILIFTPNFTISCLCQHILCWHQQKSAFFWEFHMWTCRSIILGKIQSIMKVLAFSHHLRPFWQNASPNSAIDWKLNTMKSVRKPDKSVRTLVKCVRKREKVSGVTTIRLGMQILIFYSHSYSEEYRCFHNIISRYSYLAKITFHSNRVQQKSHKTRFIYGLYMKLRKSVLNT